MGGQRAKRLRVGVWEGLEEKGQMVPGSDRGKVGNPKCTYKNAQPPVGGLAARAIDVLGCVGCGWVGKGGCVALATSSSQRKPHIVHS